MNDCYETFDCNAGEHADCCPASHQWYTPQDAFKLMEKAEAARGRLREFWAEQLNAAFSKGRQIGFGQADEMAQAMREGFGQRLNDLDIELNYLRAENEYLKSKPGVR